MVLRLSVLSVLSIFTVVFSVAQAEDLSLLDQCLLEQIHDLNNNDRTLRDIRNDCIAPLGSPPEQHPSFEKPRISDSDSMPPGFRSFFTPYKENYILLGSMQNKDGTAPFSGKTMDIRFEFGMKFRAFQNKKTINSTPPIYIGYSQKAWWDIAESSAPFAEHNYNPEVFWDFREADDWRGRGDGNVLDTIGDYVDRIGIEHQSNGLAGLESRSWDRVYAQRTFSTKKNDWSFRLKAWNVINLGVENADITDFLGNLEGKLSYRPNDKFEVSGTVMKGHHTSKYSYRVDLISHTWELANSRLMLSYYDGFGESLISYNQKTRSLRAGIIVPIEL